ncbi:MAG: GspE/PulE family protein [Candidatus Omnitrophica bacterium]|nr:GspE/PulE family protein [Candidatus Omnitrophota bacterium]
MAEIKKDTLEEGIIIKLVNGILSEGISKKASDILIEPLENHILVRYKIDGVWTKGLELPKTVLLSLLTRIKVIANLNIAERRLPQEGRFKLKLKERFVDFRVSIIPSFLGEKVSIRILDRSQLTLEIEKLGFSEEVMTMLKNAVQKPHGMILVTGPTGCGKTTTLYSLINLVNKPEVNITTTEDPVEYEIFGINQININPNINLTFANSLRAILRQDPDIIMVGEIRDSETLDIAIKAALTGHLVLSTFHSMDAPGAITRLINMGAEPFLITSCIILIASQRLVRVLCPECKQPYKPNEKILKSLSLPLTKEYTFYRPRGCERCLQRGYIGRMGICEVLLFSPEIKESILKQEPEAKIRIKAKKLGMKSLRQDGVEKIINGLTSVEEVLRVTVGDQENGFVY